MNTDYARFRPRYPPELFAWLAEIPPARELAVDVGAGNGQAAGELAKHFERVIAVEPSAAQLAHAPSIPGVSFRAGSAEALGLDGGCADLIACAQAFHWFRHDAFFAEVERVLRPAGCLAVWCYGSARISSAVDGVIHELDEDRPGRCARGPRSGAASRSKASTPSTSCCPACAPPGAPASPARGLANRDARLPGGKRAAVLVDSLVLSGPFG